MRTIPLTCLPVTPARCTIAQVEDAYGHRGVPQLVALLTEKSKDKEKAAILHSLLGKLANQVRLCTACRFSFVHKHTHER